MTAPASSRRPAPRSLPMLSGLALVLLAVPAAGFETFCSWPTSALPMPYLIDTSELTDLPPEVAEAAVVRGFETWRGPTCSAWRSRFDGPTTEGHTGPNNVMAFLESDWPAEFGAPHVVIAITLPVFGGNPCAISQADVVFNSFGWTFFDGDPAGAEAPLADLQEIATHEAGHVLGLGHSALPDATMFSTYAPPEPLGWRDLSRDDIEGVCSLYGRTGDSCSVDGDCALGELCNGGRCEPICNSDADCGGLFECQAGRCVPNGECEVCTSCVADEDCPSGVCAELDPEGLRKGCVVVGCASDLDCPGDSVCFDVGGVGACLNFDFPTAGPCPEGYECSGSSGDLDGDGIDDSVDNCLLISNPDQADFDLDGLGDACDDDVDGDGVAAAVDLCPSTPLGTPVHPTDGCSVAQACPCAGPEDGWRTPGAYVSCVARRVEQLVGLGVLGTEAGEALVSEAAQSSCGR